MKPHRGRIANWFRFPGTNYGLGYMVRGDFLDHRSGPAKRDTTGAVVRRAANGEIETCLARYTLIGKEGYGRTPNETQPQSWDDDARTRVAPPRPSLTKTRSRGGA